MKYLHVIVFLFLFGACSKPQYKVVPVPGEICSLLLDSVSVNNDVILNPTGIIATSDYLIISNLSRDTIFDVFDRYNMRHLYSDLVDGQGPNDMLPFRWIRPLNNNDFYIVGLGVPVLTEIETGSNLNVRKREKIEWEKDICQNIYPLSDNKLLIQPGKKYGEWVIYDTLTGEVVDVPEFPFKEFEKESDAFTMFQNRAVNVAVNADGNRVAFFNVMFPFVRYMDNAGNILYEANVGEEIKDVSDYFYEKHMYYTGCVSVGDFIFAKYNSKRMDSDSTSFQIWDWNGCLLGTFKVKSKINLFAVSPDARTLYAVKPDNDYVFLCNLDSVMNKIGNVSACRY